METIKFDNDIKVFYVSAKTFPEGISDATQELHKLFTFSKERKIFGLSRPENNGKIVYRAAAEELKEGEATKFNCKTLIIKKGNYICLTVNDFRKDIMSIDRAFKQLLNEPNLDPQGYCVEWYDTDKEAVKCMIRLNE
ncbi:MAG: transcriptional regulator [Bacteroidota bacterium]|nr:transcriptional regulator [Bacteroidota bacterium]